MKSQQTRLEATHLRLFLGAKEVRWVTGARLEARARVDALPLMVWYATGTELACTTNLPRIVVVRRRVSDVREGTPNLFLCFDQLLTRWSMSDSISEGLVWPMGTSAIPCRRPPISWRQLPWISAMIETKARLAKEREKEERRLAKLERKKEERLAKTCMIS